MKRLKIIIFPVLVLTLFCFNKQAFSQSGKSGATGLAFLKIGAGARANAMGNASTAITNDATSTYWNPAALATMTRPHVSFSHTEWLQDITHEFLAVTFPALGGGVGFSFYGASVDGIERRVTASAEPLGTFQSNSLAAGVSYGRPLSDALSLGVNAKYIYEKTFTESATGYAFDFAMSFSFKNQPVTLAIVAQNIGSMNKLRQESSKLPTTLRFGGAYELNLAAIDGHLILSAEGVKIIDAKSWSGVGAELLIKKYLLIRFGYQSGIKEKGLATGFGLQFRRYHLDFGLTPFSNDLGNVKRFSFALDL